MSKRAGEGRDEQAADVARIEHAGETFRRHSGFAQPEGFQGVALGGRAFFRAFKVIDETGILPPPAVPRRMSGDEGKGAAGRGLALALEIGHEGGHEGVGPVAQIGRDLLDARAGLGFQPQIIAQGPGDGRTRDARGAGHFFHVRRRRNPHSCNDVQSRRIVSSFRHGNMPALLSGSRAPLVIRHSGFVI